jgi:uncharacterized membrane protein
MINRTALIVNNMIYILFFTILSAQPTYEFQIIAIPEMDTPIRMNDDGSKIVGTNYSGQALLWTDSAGVQILGEGELWGISEDDRIFGEMLNANGYGEVALIENGEISFLGNVEGGNSCDAFYSSGLGISTDGSTGVGMGWISCGTEAFYWTDEDGIVGLGQYDGQSTKAQAVSGDGQLIGGWAQTSNRATCLWDRDGNITLLGSLQAGNDYGEVQAINNDGTQVVGYCSGNAGNNTEGFVWTEEGGMFGLGVPPNSAATNRSLAMDISENNVVIGQYLNETPVFYKACIYTEETGAFINLRDYLLDLGMEEIEGWDLHRALCVSNDGNTIAGYGKDPFNNWTGWRIRIIVGEAPGEMLLVPSEYSSIQDAINASEDRDTILVAPGTYTENINFMGKNIIIGSYGMIYGSEEMFMHQTIIDGGGNGSVVTVTSGEDSSAVLHGFTIQNGASDFGGGIMIESSEPTFEYLLINNNQADYGGGVYARYDCAPVFNYVSVIENTAGQGGGMRFRDNANPLISNCTIKWNTSSGEGGGIYCNNADPKIVYTSIVANIANEGGDAIYLKINCDANFTNTTIVGNGNLENDISSTVFCITNCSLLLTNTIIWENHGLAVEFSSTSNPNSVSVNYCDVEGGQDGITTNDNGSISWLPGNIEIDPLFCNSDSGDFNLAENSPCVGAGENNADMGAFGIGCDAILATYQDIMPLQYALYQNYPNPFNPLTTLHYDLPKDALVNITIYDMTGRIVKNLVSSQQNTGYKSIQWNATNNAGQPVSAGLYLYTIDAGQFRQAKKMVLLK